MPDRQIPPWKSRLADIGMSLFGVIMVVTPLALWVAPSKPWFYFFLELFAISGVMVWILAGYETSAAEYQNLQRFKRSPYDILIRYLQSLGLLKAPPTAIADVRTLAEKHRTELQQGKKPKS